MKATLEVELPKQLANEFPVHDADLTDIPAEPHVRCAKLVVNGKGRL